MIKVTHLTKKYGERLAVDDISFEMEKGKIYGFLGPNGAGKSTTMNMITGYIAPTKGNVLINDISMLKQGIKAKKQIGYLPEIPPLYTDMSVYEYLCFAAELKGIRGREEKEEEIKRVIKKTSLTDVKERLIKNLSKGYRQRVGLAQAMLGNPEILILDEPSVGLDPKQIVEIRNIIKELGKDHTVILSTHILSEVSAVCDHIIIIAAGKVVANDTPEALVEKYNDRQRFTLVVKGSSSGVEKVLDRISDMEEYRILKEDAKSCSIYVTANPGADIREPVSKACAQAGLVILELNVEYVSLEDVYLKLTNGEEF